jgi:regulator of replication initiation timing
MNDVPPKVLRNVVSLAKKGQTTLMQNSPSVLSRIPISKENLPVLAAFQEFLELERRRTRNNIIALSLFFTFVLFASILSAYFIGSALVNQMKTDLKGLEKNVTSDLEDTVATLDKVKLESARINDKVISQNEKISVELNKGLSSQMTEISAIKTTASELQKENEELKKEMDKIKHALVSLTQVQPEGVNTEVRKVLGTGMTKLSDTYSTARIISYSVTPSGSTRKINWRLPVILE